MRNETYGARGGSPRRLLTCTNRQPADAYRALCELATGQPRHDRHHAARWRARCAAVRQAPPQYRAGRPRPRSIGGQRLTAVLTRHRRCVPMIGRRPRLAGHGPEKVRGRPAGRPGHARHPTPQLHPHRAPGVRRDRRACLRERCTHLGEDRRGPIAPAAPRHRGSSRPPGLRVPDVRGSGRLPTSTAGPPRFCRAIASSIAPLISSKWAVGAIDQTAIKSAKQSACDQGSDCWRPCWRSAE